MNKQDRFPFVVISDEKKRCFCFADLEKGVAFGPIMYVKEMKKKPLEFQVVKKEFMTVLTKDPRDYEKSELIRIWNEFIEEKIFGPV